MGLRPSGMAGWWHRLQPVWGLRPIQVDEEPHAIQRGADFSLPRGFSRAFSPVLRRFFNGAVGVWNEIN
jgi:hypothetical protein